MITDLPTELRQTCVENLGEKLGVSQITDFQFASGGCINNGGRLTTDQGDFFIKWNSSERYPGMFTAEKKGLELLASAHAIDIPGVVLQGEVVDLSYLILDYIQSIGRRPNYWQSLGESLAQLHRNSNGTVGLDHNNYIGSLPQSNTATSSWPEFFITQRINVQLKLSRDEGRLAKEDVDRFDVLLAQAENLFPEEPPALLHGDLWSGNLMVNHEGLPALIDPAVYYGHREMDLAFSRLFGGFDDEFYQAYNEEFPLAPGFIERVDICNLYPLLVHLNLFGHSYWGQIKSIISRF